MWARSTPVSRADLRKPSTLRHILARLITEHGCRAVLEERLAPLGGVSLSRMVCGLGVCRDRLMVGLVVRDELSLMAAPDRIVSLAAEGGALF